MTFDAPPLPAEAARIVAAARRHFFAHGFRGVTMDELATELGMSKKTLYAHFPAKVALVEAVLRDKLAGASARLASHPAHAEFATALQGFLGAIRQETEEIQPAFVRDLQREAPELFARVQTFRREMVQQHLGALFRAGRKKGQVRRDLPVSLMIEILVGATDAIVNPARLGELRLSPKDAFLAVISLFLEGALARKEGEPC